MQQAYSIREAAALLNLHPETLRRAVRRGELTVARIGGRILRVSAIELERWWQTNGGGELFAVSAEAPAARDESSPGSPAEDTSGVRPRGKRSAGALKAELVADAEDPGQHAQNDPLQDEPVAPEPQVSLFDES
ncbi:MAG: DNA-binding protein [Deltaproteobacteria bacterium]|nr:MAG: DNA-binding protein [Deltaproteobacteria bacterium]